MLLAEEPLHVLGLRVANPATVFVAIVLLAPQAALLAQRGVADEA